VNCNYCGQDVFKDNKCLGCGARSHTKEPLVTPERRDPFAYNGYIIWPLRDFSRDSITFSFWQGDTHCEDIAFSWEMWRSLNRYGELPTVTSNDDPMRFVWQMFEIAQGRKDVLVIQEEKKVLPAMFLVCRAEHPKKSWTWEEMVEEYKMQGGDVLR
jgi:hypothetical protein